MAIITGHAIFKMGVASLLVTMVAAHGSSRYGCAASAKVKFGYSGPNGPDNWGGLDPAYKLCSSGVNQSPINIEKKDLVYNSALKSLDRKYVTNNATLFDSGFNIQLLFEKGEGTVFVRGKNYTLFQLHWHTPSEHTLDGERYPVELHIVHRSDDGSFAVVAILYKYGDADSFVDKLEDEVDQLAKVCSEDGRVQVAAEEVETKSLRRHTHHYYQYLGSITIPPCTENVIWTILGKVRSISKEQVAMLQAPLDEDYKNNARPTQALNGRIVELYDEKHKVEIH